MKYLAITAALLFSSTAFAQSTPSAEPASPSMPMPEMPPTGEMSAPPAMPAAPDAPMTTPATPDAMPEQAMMQPPAAPAPVTQTDYPRCSRTVVDQCIQGASRERDTKRKPRRG